MADGTEKIQKQLNNIRECFAAGLPQKIIQIEKIWETLQKQTAGKSHWQSLQIMLHNLIGASAVFGFPELSDTARELENHLKTMMENNFMLMPQVQIQFQTLLEKLNAGARQCLAPNRATHWIAPTQISTKEEPYAAPENRLIYILMREADDLSKQISYFGYTVQIFGQAAQLKRAVQDTPPAAIIMDHAFIEENSVKKETITEIQNITKNPIPVLFVSEKTGLISRLEALRVGGCAYITKPIDINELIDKFESVIPVKEEAPFRILIVEDLPELAHYYTIILGQAGMTTCTISDPLQIMHTLSEFGPEIILMDLYMPICNGMELAAIIRQQEIYVSIPIVFLSVETNIDKKLAGLRLGGDDFLTKPIQPEHLISSITSRVQRSRILRAFMVKDSLTGLINHTTLKKQLTLEIDGAKRQNLPLSFAMLDLDYFKTINDAYGHPIGDCILKSLSYLLQIRLRKTDIIGRYGGEEFGIILPNTDGETGLKILEGIRDNFSRVKHLCEDKEFTITFSGGIASFPKHEESNLLINMADKALYQAKNSGRNRVILIDKP